LPTSRSRPRLDSVEIPNLVGRTWDEEQLTAELGELTLGVVAVEVETVEFTEGTIMGQAPAAGSLHRGGITVTVEVAVAPDLPAVLSMPEVVGLNEAEARGVLAAAGLGVEVYVETFFDEETEQFGGEPGVVWRQTPAAGVPVEPGGSAEIWVNPEP
jgi:beta-lactam-binding protein with PASTA domain